MNSAKITAKYVRIFLFFIFMLSSTFIVFSQEILYDDHTSNGTSTNEFVVPAGITRITIEAWGAGGAGAYVNNNRTRGAGGGAGAYIIKEITVSGGDIFDVVVGEGVESNSSFNPANGIVINSSVFQRSNGAERARAAGGQTPVRNSTTGGAGGSVAGSAGDTRYAGGNGGNGGSGGSWTESGGGGGAAGTTGAGGNGGNQGSGVGGTGANDLGGDGGDGPRPRNSGRAGEAYGAGGSGGNKWTSSNRLGGNGADGAVRITWLAPDIEVSGQGIAIVGDGTNVPDGDDDTDFETVVAGVESNTNTFTITNVGSSNLTLGAINLTGTGAANFTIDSAPAPSTVLSPGATASITITFTSSSAMIHQAQLNIASNDYDEGATVINLQGQGIIVFFDSDGDGINDDVDIDDDNDGIIDSEEELACQASATSTLVNYKFLNETFGAGVNRVEINTSYDATTDYCWEDGINGVGGNIGSTCGSLNTSGNLGDGKYVVHHMVTNSNGIYEDIDTDIASWVEQYWWGPEDHTEGDTNGRMAIFNASHAPGLFYTAHIVGALPNVPITYDFWALNLDRNDAPNIGTRNRPDIQVDFIDATADEATYTAGDILTNLATGLPATISTGDVPPAVPGNQNASWHNYTADLIFAESEFKVVFRNLAPGGAGNDLAIDDIKIEQTLCDLDSDGVADLFDLDNDDDGIADIYEVGLGSLNGGAGYIDPSSPSWIDVTGASGVPDGLHDGVQALIAAMSVYPPDTDNDGTPDYLDLDSDNDGLYDVDEARTSNASLPVGHEHGDGDVSGDGTGNAIEMEAFRQKDTNGDGILEFYGDGILDIFEHTAGNYGVSGQSDPLDSDFDGVPDYLDRFSNDPTDNPANGTDFDNSIYAIINPGLDSNGDGLIDGANTDSDDDGIVDAIDTDNTAYGSPRLIDYDLEIDFDGRNDYVADMTLSNEIATLGDLTMTAWVMIEGTSGVGRTEILGNADQITLYMNDSRRPRVAFNGSQVLVSTTTLPLNEWVHLSVILDDTTDEIRLYINGVEDGVKATGITNTINASADQFTIAKQSSNDQYYFNGVIDEIKIFDVALSDLELHKTIHQEINNNGGMISGDILTQDTNTSWTNLLRNFRFDSYRDDVMDDNRTVAVETTGAIAYNIKTLQVESAPIPFTTTAAGLKTATGTWTEGAIWDIETLTQTVVDAELGTYNPSIIRVSHDLTINEPLSALGLVVDPGVTVTIAPDGVVSSESQYGSPLYVTWSLDNDGTIDLQGESQLIQTTTSTYTGTGDLKRIRRSADDSQTYNYFSSPVSNVSGSVNGGSRLDNVIYQSDGTTPAVFCAGYDCADNATDNISSYWIYTFPSAPFLYENWVATGSGTTIPTGSGFTMKGSVASGSGLNIYQRVFVGKPNNGGGLNPSITQPVSAVGDYVLVGNPFPSSIDAWQFIDDNITGTGVDAITGTLYFWEHWSEDTHNLSGYQGGYGTYTKLGGLPPVSHPDIDGGGSGTGLNPSRYIPVAQGFFVESTNTNSISFDNGQRIFEVETNNDDVGAATNDGSNFLRGASDKQVSKTIKEEVERIRLEFISPDNYIRQTMVGFIDGASDELDRGYDGFLNSTEDFRNDAYFIQEGKKLLIQAFGEFKLAREIKIGIKIDESESGGLQTIGLKDIGDLVPGRDVYIKDNLTGAYHDLREGPFTINLLAGEYIDRFVLVFQKKENQENTLSINEDTLSNEIKIYMDNGASSIEINNQSEIGIESVQLYNQAGQLINSWTGISLESDKISLGVHLSTGIYIASVQTTEGKIAKKLAVK